MQSLGFYLQCYKNPYATYKCLENCRKFYPKNTIVLLSDNGYNYSEMANYFNCTYIHEYQNIWLTHKNLDDGSHFTNSYNLINRIKKAYNLINEDYIMWLEDDVSINNAIIDNFKYDLNGFSPNQFSDMSIAELQTKYPFLNNNIIYRYNGHGGSVFHKKNFLTYLENIEIINDILTNWKIFNFPSDLGQDFFFSAIILLNKGSIGSYDGHEDCTFKNEHIIVQHQFKTFYGHPMPEDLKYLVN